MKINFRDAEEKDLVFLYQLHKLTLKEYVEKTWGWDEVWQWNYFQTHFNPKLIKIIIFSNKEIGCLRTEEDERNLAIDLLEILPDFQNKGIGSKIIRDIIKNATKKSKGTSLTVLKTNTRAKGLYDRLGFLVRGDTETHFKMEITIIT